MEIESVKITENAVADTDICEDLIPEELNVVKLIGDTGYYKIETLEKLLKDGIMPVIRLPSHAVIHEEEGEEFHNKIVKYIEEKGIYAFHNKFGCKARNKVESQFSRIKRCIGESFKTQKLKSQKTEGVIISNIINIWNSLGRCTTVKV